MYWLRRVSASELRGDWCGWWTEGDRRCQFRWHVAGSSEGRVTMFDFLSQCKNCSLKSENYPCNCACKYMAVPTRYQQQKRRQPCQRDKETQRHIYMPTLTSKTTKSVKYTNSRSLTGSLLQRKQLLVVSPTQLPSRREGGVVRAKKKKKEPSQANDANVRFSIMRT